MTQSQTENPCFLHLNPSNDNHFLVFYEVFARKTCFPQLKTKGGAEPPYPCIEHSPRFAGKIWTRERPGRDARPDLKGGVGIAPPPPSPGIGAFGADAGALGPFT